MKLRWGLAALVLAASCGDARISLLSGRHGGTAGAGGTGASGPVGSAGAAGAAATAGAAGAAGALANSGGTGGVGPAGHGGGGGQAGGAPSCSSGACRTALCFDEPESAVRIPHHSSLDLPSAFTVEGWVLLREGAPGGIMMKHVSGYEDKVLSAVAGGTALRSYYFYTGATVLSEPLAADTWHHFAITSGSAQMRLFVDGELVTTEPIAGEVRNSTGDLFLGACPRGDSLHESFRGCLSELRWSRGERYAAGFTPARHFAVDADTLLLLPLDEGAGTTVYDFGPGANVGEIGAGVRWAQLEHPEP